MSVYVVYEFLGLEMRVRADDDGTWLEAITVGTKEVPIEHELSRSDFTDEQWRTLKEEISYGHRQHKPRW